MKTIKDIRLEQIEKEISKYIKKLKNLFIEINYKKDDKNIEYLVKEITDIELILKDRNYGRICKEILPKEKYYDYVFNDYPLEEPIKLNKFDSITIYTDKEIKDIHLFDLEEKDIKNLSRIIEECINEGVKIKKKNENFIDNRNFYFKKKKHKYKEWCKIIDLLINVNNKI